MIQSVVLILLIVIPYCPMGSTIPHTLTILEDTLSVDCAQESTEIQLRYYLRRYYIHDYAGNGVNITLNLLVEGADDLDCVIMMCTPEDDSSYNVSMSETSTVHLYTTLFQIEPHENATVSHSGILMRYSVQYFVNTTSGIRVISEMCPYQILCGGEHGDGVSIRFYNTPDLWYEEGTTDHAVTWDTSAGSPTFYRLYEDDFLVGAWSWSGSLTINVDGLSLGDHIFKIRATEGGASGSEEVTVHVVTTIPYGVATGSVGPITFALANLPPIAVGLVIGIFLIPVVFIIYRRKLQTTQSS
ncbi:MAG: hypothetical protein ACTSUZ_12685 [Candidatus Thorarchaeota archaeon]